MGFTRELVNKIRQEHMDGMSVSALAEKYNVTEWLICQILRKKY